MKLALLILFNGFLFSISPSSIHDSKSTNESPIVNDQKKQEKPSQILDQKELEKAPSLNNNKSKVQKPEICTSEASAC